MGSLPEIDHRPVDVDKRLGRLAAGQHGLVRRRQVLDAGCSARMLDLRVDRGLLVRVEPRVYRVFGAPPTWAQRLLSACWAENALAYRRTAAALHGLDGYGSRLVEVVTNRGRRRVNRSVHVHESGDLVTDDGVEVDGIPVTRVERTIIDLAGVVPPARVEQALDDALRRGLTTPELVHRYLLRFARRGRPGIAAARELVEARLATSSIRPGEFERRVGRLLVDAGCPVPVYELEVRAASGLLVARVDLAYPPPRVAIECDSERWHSGRQRRQHDLQRQNALILAGWTVLRFTWDDLVRRPDYVVAQVKAALAAAV